MKKTLIRILPALIIGVALVVSAVIFERGMQKIAGNLYLISRSVKDVAYSAETMYQTVQDFPSFLTVQLWNDTPLEISGSIYTH